MALFAPSRSAAESNPAASARPARGALELVVKAALCLAAAAIAVCSTRFKANALNPPLRALRARVDEADAALAKMNADFDLYYEAKQGKKSSAEVEEEERHSRMHIGTPGESCIKTHFMRIVHTII